MTRFSDRSPPSFGVRTNNEDRGEGTALETVDTARMREHNAGLLLNLIWQQEDISRAEIARRTGLSRSTVSAIVADLIVSGLVHESGAGDSRGGRRPTLLRFADRAYGIVGIEMGASHLHVVATDLRGRVLAERQRQHPVVAEPQSTLALLRELVADCLAKLALPRGQLLGVGVAAPCPVYLDAPGRLCRRLMPKWNDVSITGELGQSFGCPIYMDNDANLGALAERWWGAGRSGEDLAFIKIATGVGAGLIIGGQIYRGAGGTAGEIGHVAIDPRGPVCRCGLTGCLAAMVGAEPMAERARAELSRGTPSRLSPQQTSLHAIAAAARDGDALAMQLVAEAGRHLGIGVAGLLNLLNPAVVVLAGPLIAAGDLLLAPIRNTVQHSTLWESVARSRIQTSELGEAAIAIGAATQVLSAALENQALFPTWKAAQAVG
jgi:predicted NBD/HSP70 family sugar kinase